MLDTIHDVAPGAAVPMVIASEVKNTGPLNIERDILVVGKLVEEMAGVGALELPAWARIARAS